jgi:sortase A
MSGSTIVASLMVAAAGLIAWTGLESSHGSSQASPAAAIVPSSAEAAVGTAPAAAVQPDLQGTLPTRVVIRHAGIDTPISEVGIVREDGALAWQTAWRAAGHHLNSARPGQPGNMILTGHVSVADAKNLAVFQHLDRVAVGDEIQVYSGDRAFRYRVTTVRVAPPTAIEALDPDHRALVTLITCTRDLKQRLLVVGELVG